MFRGHLTHSVIRTLDWLIAKRGLQDDAPEHLQTGRRGEEDASFFLRLRGYKMITRNYRSPHHRGEIDLIAWDGDVLCFIEVKTRTTRAVKPAEAAVDREKQHDLNRVARDYLRHMPSAGLRGSPGTQQASDPVPWRFDIVSVYYDDDRGQPSFELFQNAFSVSYNRSFARSR